MIVAILIVGIAAGLTVLGIGANHSSNTGSSSLSASIFDSSSSIASLSSYSTTTNSYSVSSISSSSSLSTYSNSQVTSSSSDSLSSSLTTSSTTSTSNNYYIIQQNQEYFAGFVAHSFSSSVTYVSATWTVPAGDCNGAPKNQYYPAAAMWIGIGDSRTVEQIGTDTDCQLGSPAYYALYDFYPSSGDFGGSTFINNVLPGDLMEASVSYSSASSYTLTISDKNAGWKHSFTGSGGNDWYAEWIVEAIHSPGFEPLTNFGSVTFNSCTMTQLVSESPVSGPITNYAAVYQYTMVDQSGNVMVTTSNPSNGGTSFTVTWIRSS